MIFVLTMALVLGLATPMQLEDPELDAQMRDRREWDERHPEGQAATDVPLADEAPPADAAPAEQPVAEQPAAEQPPADQPVAEQTPAEQPPADAPPADLPPEGS